MATEQFFEGMDGNYLSGNALEGEMADSEIINRFKKKEEAKKLVAWVKSEYEKCKQSRKTEEQDWYLQLSFYNGNQYHSWRRLGNGQVLAEEPNPQGLPRVTVNRIEPVVRTEIAKTTSGHPSATVIPASNDDDDLMAASAAEQVWQSLYDRESFQTRILQKAEFWRATTGNAFIKTYWDPSIKEIVPTPVVDPYTGEKKVIQQVASQGDVKFEVVSPFHLFVPDLSEEDLESQPYIFNVYTKSEEWVRSNFGSVLPKDFKPAKVSTSELLDAALMDMRNVDNSKPDAILVIEMWAKPNGCPYLPKGGLVTIVDNEIVQMAENGIPYSHKQYPFAHVGTIPTGKFYRRGTVKTLIPIQREYNRLRSQIIHAKNLMAKPQMMFQEGSVDPRKITARAGIWVPIRPGFQYPTPVPIQPLPQYVINEVKQLEMDFEDLSGQHAVSRGESGGVTAATAINYLQERDDAYLTTVFSAIEAAVEKIAKHSIALFIQYVTQPRLIKTVGSDGAFDATVLSGADIASGNDIRVESGSALPTSKSARQALITEWMKMGFISPQDGLRILDMGMLKQYYNLLKLDENQSQRENLMMKRLTDEAVQQFQMNWEMGASNGDPDKTVPGQTDAEGNPIALEVPAVIPVHDYDNHAVHIEVHNRFRKSQSFEILPDVVKAEFQKHISMHEAALQQKMMEQAMMGMMGEGAAPGQPTALPSEQAGQMPQQAGQTSEQLQ
jgi:hypothetical protein